MENKDGDALYKAFCELNKDIALKYGIPQKVPYDNAYKGRINDFYKLLGIKNLPYPELEEKKG